MSIDEAAPEALPWTSHGRDPAAVRAQQLAMAWQRVARDASQLTACYLQAGVATVPAYHSPTGHRRDRVWFPVWLLSAYQPRRKEYVETVDGRALGITTLPEMPGIALLADATLSEYVVVRRHPMLTQALRQARPDTPPSHAMFVALMGRVRR